MQDSATWCAPTSALVQHQTGRLKRRVRPSPAQSAGTSWCPVPGRGGEPRHWLGFLKAPSLRPWLMNAERDHEGSLRNINMLLQPAGACCCRARAGQLSLASSASSSPHCRPQNAGGNCFSLANKCALGGRAVKAAAAAVAVEGQLAVSEEPRRAALYGRPGPACWPCVTAAAAAGLASEISPPPPAIGIANVRRRKTGTPIRKQRRREQERQADGGRTTTCPNAPPI